MFKQYQISICILSIVSILRQKEFSHFRIDTANTAILESRIIEYAVNQLVFCFAAFLISSVCSVAFKIFDISVHSSILLKNRNTWKSNILSRCLKMGVQTWMWQYVTDEV